MADDPTSSITQQLPALQNMQAMIVSLTKSISDFSVDGVLAGFADLSAKGSKAMDDLAKTINGDAGLTFALDKVTQGLATIQTMASNFHAFDNIAVQGGYMSSTMGEQFKLLVDRMGSVSAAATAMGGNTAKALVSGGTAAVQSYLDHVSSAEKLEHTYLNLQGATGNYAKEVINLASLDDRVSEFNKVLTTTAGSSGQSLEAVSKYAATLENVPGIFTQVVDAGGGADDKINGLAASFRLAAGSGRDISLVTKAMAEAYENLGNASGKVTDSTQKGAQLFGLMTDASNKLNLRFADTSGFLETVAKDFKHIGDNSEGAINILSRFSGALQSTGLTAKGSVEVIGDMVDSIKKLDMGTKAFISAQSGGPGGLQGAFQIENLMRKGKVDEVAKMMQKSLMKQAGGRIYTQEEAGNSPQAAAQFMRQREMIKSGAFGGMAKTDEDASHLLEAFAKGPQAAGQAISASSALKNTMGQGGAVQERQLTELQRINNSMDRVAVATEQNMKMNARDVVGTTGKEGNGRSTERAINLQDYLKQSTQPLIPLSLKDHQAAGVGFTNLKEQKEGYHQVGSSTASVLAALSSSARGAAKNGLADGQKIITALIEAMKKDQQQASIKHNIHNSEEAVARGQKLHTATREALREAPTRIPALAMHTPWAQHGQKPSEANGVQSTILVKIEAPEGMIATATSDDDNTVVRMNAASSGLYRHKGK